MRSLETQLWQKTRALEESELGMQQLTTQYELRMQAVTTDLSGVCAAQRKIHKDYQRVEVCNQNLLAPEVVKQARKRISAPIRDSVRPVDAIDI